MTGILVLLALQASASPAGVPDAWVSTPAPAAPRHSRPVLKSGAMTADDYPIEALRNEVEGSVYVSFDIAADGRAHACRVERSSGFAVLDAATCRIVDTRYRLEPARDSEGRALPIRAEQWVKWQLPQLETDVISPRAAETD